MPKKKIEPVEEEILIEAVINTPIAPLTVDYANEGLNDMARKINEIISRIN